MSDTDSPPQAPSAKEQRENHLAEVALLFLRLGFTAFGGPAAHIAMMREEVVRRRKWISGERFIDLMSVTTLIPGPNSTELAIYLGFVRAGWPGLIIAGTCFIGPAMLIVMALAWAYVAYGSLPQVGWLFYGIKPVVIAIIAAVLVGLGRTTLRSVWPVVLAVLVLGLYLFGINTIALLFGGALLFGIIRWSERMYKQRRKQGEEIGSFFLPLSLAGIKELWQHISIAKVGAGIAAVAAATVPYSLPLLFLTFLKIGGTLYGSGYVILAFLRPDFVVNFHWLTDRQLLDAVSIGQFTPGPVFTTATFIGFVVGGWQGALVATLGIFLPSFVFIAIIHPLATTLRRSSWTSTLLDGLNIAAVALMAGVLFQLGRSALIDVVTWVVALIAFAVLLRFKINSAWLILAGAAIGLVRFWVF
ncbi:MAG TPA: chromate efflux transporter [Ktedonobacteraceae bacterium]|jgi:chromate transporter|nr:chromate efflux transporter [Ktedonobacteraceae bacterium]